MRIEPIIFCSAEMPRLSGTNISKSASTGLISGPRKTKDGR